MERPSPLPMNLFGLDNPVNGISYGKQDFFFQGFTALPEGLGWFIVVGLGFVFCAVTSLLVFLDQRFGGTKTNSEQFSSAGRSVGTGLIACDIVSKWTWAATLLQSSNVAYKLGVSGPFWYASGATIQVLLFAILAVEVKRKAPTAHTFLEIIRARWGKPAHIVFMCFGFATNIIVTSMLILGGAAVTNALTGVDLYAAAFLIPISVVFYTAFGGLKACFIASWAHCGVIYVALCVFVFLVYASNSDLGSIPKVYDNLDKVAAKYWADFKVNDMTPRTNYLPLNGNKGQSYLTILSEGGLVFGVINIIGNFGTVFVDQSYWQSAIAAKPSSAYKGYIVGGLCWFAVPFTMATTMGLGSRALDLPITIAESNAGLVPPALAVHLLGRGGGFLLVLQLFLAVTSTASAEQIAVSSLVTYDVYFTYINPKATGQQILRVFRVCIVCYGVLSGVFAIVLLQIGLNLGYVYLMMGVIIGSAVPPVAMAILWDKLSALGAITAAVVGMAASITSWLVRAQVEFGEVTLNSTGADYPMLTGNMVAIGVSALVCTVMGYAMPQNFDWKELESIPVLEVDKDLMDVPEEDSPEAMEKAVKFTWIVGGTLALVLIVVWPALAVPAGVFSKGYFTFWVIIAIAWGVGAAATTFVLPIWEARTTISTIFGRMIKCQRADVPGGVDYDGTDIKAVELK